MRRVYRLPIVVSDYDICMHHMKFSIHYIKNLPNIEYSILITGLKSEISLFEINSAIKDSINVELKFAGGL